MSVNDLNKRVVILNISLYGTADEKIAALDWLQSKHSWDAKRWIQGLLFDGDAKVRLRAAQYIADALFALFTRYASCLSDGKRRNRQNSTKRAVG